MKGRGSKRALSELIFPPSTWNHKDVGTVDEIPGRFVRLGTWMDGKLGTQNQPTSVNVLIYSGRVALSSLVGATL